ncbi:hypothetical protein AAVH_09419 [Aphelenchoides avenae]|nr:hypothetical protein AAVH_09419 [Aphelenchus avenae]
MNGLIASDPEARHICVRSSNGTTQPRTSNGHAKPSYTKKDCVDEVYDPTTTAGPGMVSYYSGMYSRRLEFRLLGDSKHVPGVKEYYCTACRKVDKNFFCIVCVKDGHFVAVDPDYSFDGHVCIKAEKELVQRAGPVTRQTTVKSTVAKQAPKRKSPAAVTSTAKHSPNGRRTLGTKLPVKPPGRESTSGSKAQDFGKVHFNASGEVECTSRVHKGRSSRNFSRKSMPQISGKTLRFVFHAHAPTGSVCYYRCDACHELCAKYKRAGAVPRMLPVRDDKLMRNPDECGTNFGHLCQMPKKVDELQARRASPQNKKSRLDSPALQDHEFSAGIDANVDDVAENFEDMLDNLDSLLSPEPGAEGRQCENDEGAGIVNFIATPPAASASGPQHAAAPANTGEEDHARSVTVAASEDRKPDIASLRRQQHLSSVTNISLHPEDDDEIQFLGVTRPERRQSSQLPEIEVVGVTPGKPNGKQKTTSAPSAATLPPPAASVAPAVVPPAAAAVTTHAGPSPATNRSAASVDMPGSRRSSTTGPSTASVAPPRQQPACASSGATARATGAAQVASDLNRIDDDDILLLDLDNILEDQTPWTPRRVKQEVKQEAALQVQPQQGIPPVIGHKPPSGYVTNFGKAHFSPDGTLAFFTDILGLNYTFEQLEMLRATANGEQTETRIYQCKTCMEVASRLGMSVDFPRVKTVNGYFVDTDPGRPRGNAHLCTRNPNI